MASFEDREDIEPIIHDEPIRAPMRPSASRSRGSESAALWGTVALIGAVVGIYVLVKPPQPPPAVEPGPIVRQATPASETPVKRKRSETRRTKAPLASTPTVTVHQEPERKVVDPIQGFDSNEAFDNPASPGRYGQRRSGLYEPNATPPAARPNRPDPSFGNPQ